MTTKGIAYRMRGWALQIFKQTCIGLVRLVVTGKPVRVTNGHTYYLLLHLLKTKLLPTLTRIQLLYNQTIQKRSILLIEEVQLNLRGPQDQA